MLKTVISEGKKLRTATICMVDGSAISSAWIILASESKSPPLYLTVGACG